MPRPLGYKWVQTEVELYWAGSDPPHEIFVVGAYEVRGAEDEWEHNLYPGGSTKDSDIEELCALVEKDYLLEFSDSEQVDERRVKLLGANPKLRDRLIEHWRSKGLGFE